MENRLLPPEVNGGSVGVALGDSTGKFQAHQLPLELFGPPVMGSKILGRASPFWGDFGRCPCNLSSCTRRLT